MERVSLFWSTLLCLALIAASVGHPLTNLAQTDTDWPMLMHDPAHSGHTTSTLDLEGSLYLQWKFSFGERVEVEVQPVIADGRVYVGVMNGKMYCLDALTGSQLWVYKADGPIPQTAAVAGGKVYFGALDGRVYALNASDGSEAWTFQTEGPVYSAPTVSDGTVFIGGLDGYFYALDADDGTLRWRYKTDGAVDTSPAVGNGRVYFGAEDMYAYCLRTDDGQLIWKRALSGYGMHNTYPVLASDAGVVIFVTIKPGASSYVHVENYPDASVGSDIRTTWQQYYNSYPERRHLFYLDAATGADKWDGGTAFQPFPLPYWGLIVPILDGNGYAWFPSPSGVEGYKGGLGHDNRLIKVNLLTGAATQVADDADFQMVNAETGRHTFIGDKYVYTISEDVGAYDPATGVKRTLFGNGFGTHMDPMDPLPTKHLWRYGGVIAMGGAANASPLTVANGRGYYVSYGWLYCIGPQQTGVTSVSPRSDLVEPYWPPEMRPSAGEVYAEFTSRIAQIVNAGHLGPSARFAQAGTNGTDRGYGIPFQAFWFEGELVRTLAESLPFLPPDSQTQVRDYLRSEAQNYLFNPTEYESRQNSLSYAPGVTTYWWAHNENLIGERFYAMWAYANYTGDWNMVSSNWSFIKGLFWDRFASTFDESLGFCEFPAWRTGTFLDINQQIGGTLGIARMAAYVGDTATEQKARDMLAKMYDARVRLAHYVRDLYDAGKLTRVDIRLEPDGRLNNGDIMTYYNNPCETIPYREYRDRDSDIRQVVWWGDGGDEVRYYSGLGEAKHYAVMVGYVPMYPEVADLLRTHLLTETTEYLNTYTINDPWWWLNDLSHSKVGNAESLYSSPSLSFSIFQTKAYVLRESFDELVKQLPLPYTRSGYRDLYRLQNLLALLRALPQSDKKVNAFVADAGNVLTYTITLQGTTASIVLTDTIPTGTEYIPGSAYISPTLGTLSDTDGIKWRGEFTQETTVEIGFAVTVVITAPSSLINTAVISSHGYERQAEASTMVNPYKVFLPQVSKNR